MHPEFRGSDKWYDQVAKSRPPKDEPWYEVLVHNTQHQTYVSQQNLEADGSGSPVEHPLLRLFFTDFDEGLYSVGGLRN